MAFTKRLRIQVFIWTQIRISIISRKKDKEIFLFCQKTFFCWMKKWKKQAKNQIKTAHWSHSNICQKGCLCFCSLLCMSWEWSSSRWSCAVLTAAKVSHWNWCKSFAKGWIFTIFNYCSLFHMVPCSSTLSSPEACPVLIKDQRRFTGSSPCCQGRGRLFFWSCGLQTSPSHCPNHRINIELSDENRVRQIQTATKININVKGSLFRHTLKCPIFLLGK